MMKKQWPKSLNPMAKTALETLKAETGKTLSIEEDFADIYRLHVLAEELCHPGDLANEVILLDAPMLCGDVRLYRLTMGAMIWLEEFGQQFPDDENLVGYALIYAMANCREPSFLEPRTPAQSKEVVRAWVKKVNCVSFDSMERCVEHLLPRGSAEKDDEKDAGSGMGPVLAMLLAEIGHTPHYWLHEISMELASEILSGLCKLKFDETGDGKKDNPFAPYTLALKEFHYFKLELLDRYAKAD